MSGSFEEIDDKLERVKAAPRDIEALLTKMERDLQAAKRNRAEAPDWAVKMAHEAVLTGCTALIRTHGYRVKTETGYHQITLRFAQLALPEHMDLFDRADLLRRRRHRVSYSAGSLVAKEEVDGAIELAQTLLPILREAVRSKLPPPS